ncbi:MAG: phage late control D family protein, partial [Pseudomonadota bacterium]
MPQSPQPDDLAPIQVIVSADGKVVDDAQLVAVDVEHRVNRIGRAVLTYEDGAAGFRDFPLADAKTFEPGASIIVEARYGSGTKRKLFQGIVVAARLAIGDRNEVRLRIECRQEAVALTLVRRSLVRQQVKDSDVITKLISAGGLTAEVADTKVVLPELVQHDVTDWDFVVARAEANGLVVVADFDKKVRLIAPDLARAAELVVTYGRDLIRFDALLDAREQHPSASASTWSPGEQS